MLLVADVLYTAGEWRSQQATVAGGQPALPRVLDKLDALTLLPRSPLEVDGTQADFRLAPPPLQRLTPPLLLTAVECTHAKYVALKRQGPASASAAAVGAGAELRALRERAEALVAFGSISVWRAAEALGGGAAQMPAAASQQLATWLSDMA